MATERQDGETRLVAFEATVGHTFAARDLLLDALTHRSYVNEHPGPRTVSNERLEFLGDAVLALISADLLYREYPDSPEGELTRTRAALVRTTTLAALARQIGVGAYLRLGRSEETTGGREREPLLAGAFEAVVGALYLDGGMAEAWRFVEPLLRAELAGGATGQKDDKSLLQELAQARLGVTPTYHIVEQRGPSHERIFEVEVRVGAWVAARGVGPSKRQAERAAAGQALAEQGWREAGV